MRGMRVAAAAVGVFIGSTGIAQAQEAPGLKVGEHAPALTLKDQNGEARSLDGLVSKGKGKVALVFYRSADW